MDQARANRMTKELSGTKVSGWRITKYLGAGKSALVFGAEKDGMQAALKVFDPELVERFGKETQLRRIDRERGLIGEKHENLVAVYDGGECSESNLLFVAMEYLHARNLEDALLDIPRERIAALVSQVAAAAVFLEERGLAHRDIKPSNIAVTGNFGRAVLLDLGVLRPFGNPGLTDEDEKVFVGTLRYSSPEFLMRKERDTIDGWRALTHYQLGAVLHDMIMRKPLFQEFSEPFAMLVEAVKTEQPQVQADDVPTDLVLLAQNCLIKSPDTRLELVSWSDFTEPAPSRPLAESARDRVIKRSLLVRTEAGVEAEPDTCSTPTQLAHQVVNSIDSIVHLECAGNPSFPRMQIMTEIQDVPTVRVEFDSSASLSVPERLSISLLCHLVDEATMSIRLEASACLLPGGFEHGESPSKLDLFRGPLDSPSLTPRLRDYLYMALDAAQARYHSSLRLDAPFWLTLDPNKEGET